MADEHRHLPYRIYWENTLAFFDAKEPQLFTDELRKAFRSLR